MYCIISSITLLSNSVRGLRGTSRSSGVPLDQVSSVWTERLSSLSVLNKATGSETENKTKNIVLIL